MKRNMKRLLATACALSMTMQMSVSAAYPGVVTDAPPEVELLFEDTQHTKDALAQEDDNGDAFTLQDGWTMNMIHNNPGLEPYESPYNDSEFLAARDIDGHVFFLYD